MKTLDEFIKLQGIVEDPPHIHGRLYSVETLRVLLRKTADATIQAVRIMKKIDEHDSTMVDEFERKVKDWMGREKEAKKCK